jgi:hypothetical protein
MWRILQLMWCILQLMWCILQLMWRILKLGTECIIVGGAERNSFIEILLYDVAIYDRLLS